jgi:hypothetical protein
MSRWQRMGPIVTLLLLSPVIGEVMSGATRLSYIFVLVPEIMVWGCGALLIRELVRRWSGGWTSMLLMGFGLSIAEEFVIQQTSIAPLPWLGDRPAYGRVWGVNWPWFIFMLGYEAIWIVLVPVQVTELLFPARRRNAWLRTRGLFISGAVFLVGSCIAWFAWTQQARPNAFHVPVYYPPMATVLAGAVAIALLGAAAYAVREVDRVRVEGAAPEPWVVALVGLLMGLPWYGLMVLVFVPGVTLPLGIPMLAAAVWAGGVFVLIRHWSRSAAWGDIHRWAICLGALLVCMTGGFLGAGSWPRMDVVGKAVLNVLAVVAMAVLAARIRRRAAG